MRFRFTFQLQMICIKPRLAAMEATVETEKPLRIVEIPRDADGILMRCDGMSYVLVENSKLPIIEALLRPNPPSINGRVIWEDH
jgi:hypothetical protein